MSFETNALVAAQGTRKAPKQRLSVHATLIKQDAPVYLPVGPPGEGQTQLAGVSTYPMYMVNGMSTGARGQIPEFLGSFPSQDLRHGYADMFNAQGNALGSYYANPITGA